MPERTITRGVIERFAIIALLSLAVAAAILYVGDWAVWRAKFRRGAGMGTVQVTRTVVAPLKGNKEEYYADGTTDVRCSRSLFPEGGADACWWLQRHNEDFER